MKGSTSSDQFINFVSGPLPLSAEGPFDFMFVSLQDLKTQPKSYIQVGHSFQALPCLPCLTSILPNWSHQVRKIAPLPLPLAFIPLPSSVLFFFFFFFFFSSDRDINGLMDREIFHVWSKVLEQHAPVYSRCWAGHGSSLFSVLFFGSPAGILLFFLPFWTSSTFQGPAQFQHLLRNPLQLDFEFILPRFCAWGCLMENTLVSGSLASLVFYGRLSSSNRDPTLMS